jgi:hypothetical protein
MICQKTPFNRDPATWQVDYRACFDAFKDALQQATTLYYPEFDLDWILRADASKVGVGIVLFQVFVTTSGEKIHQPILFASQKFSDQARKWSTYAQESFAMYFALKQSEYYLHGKPFIYKGNNANLQWMERSTDAKIIRQQIYMQQFPFIFCHIPGT